MLIRLYIDNYKCFSGFEFKPDRLQPIFGRNATGKSSLFGLLREVQQFVVFSMPVDYAFPRSSLTRWDSRLHQTVELDVLGSGGSYGYRMVIGHGEEGAKAWVELEELTFDGRRLFSSSRGNAQIYRDDGSPGPPVSLDWTRSGISLLGPTDENRLLTWFKVWMENLLIVDIVPALMSSWTEREESILHPGCRNFASWFRHVWQDSTETVLKLSESLREIFEGFQSLSLKALPDGSQRVLKLDVLVESPSGGAPSRSSFLFDELSDGERALIALYTITGVLSAKGGTVCFDEPDNYLGIAEVQPLLMQLEDLTAEGSAQVLVASHNSEVLNYFATEAAVLLSRTNHGPARAPPFRVDPDSGLRPAELVARGWEGP
ncbi:MAG: AAA family ATPase [Planctomycetes bacterium]|nr:AAA family ATPase [Planctomycetota bacterium]